MRRGDETGRRTEEAATAKAITWPRALAASAFREGSLAGQVTGDDDCDPAEDAVVVYIPDHVWDGVFHFRPSGTADYVHDQGSANDVPPSIHRPV